MNRPQCTRARLQERLATRMQQGRAQRVLLGAVRDRRARLGREPQLAAALALRLGAAVLRPVMAQP
jgi:hypothetical protein